MTTALPRPVAWTYGLAFLGVHLAFMPLLVLLLPRRVEALAPGDPATLLSWLLLTGGVVAGLAYILAGAISDLWFDRFGNRRGLIAIGSGLVAISYAGFALAHDEWTLMAALVFFQLALNCCFAPLGAVLADHIPDAHKGRMGGLMNAALPASTLLIAPVTWLFPTDDPRAFLIVGALAVGCIVPLLVCWNMPALAADRSATTAQVMPPAEGSPAIFADFAKAWIARLLIQTGAAFVIGYIFLYLTALGAAGSAWAEIDPSKFLALLMVPAALLAILATIASGHVTDLRQARRVPLTIAAIVLAVGLVLLAVVPVPAVFILAYGLFQIGLAAFLSIDTALVAQLLGQHRRRGLLLGVMNLSNTLPAIIAPLFVLMAVGPDQLASALGTIFATFAAGSIVAAGLVLAIRTVR